MIWMWCPALALVNLLTFLVRAGCDAEPRLARMWVWDYRLASRVSNSKGSSPYLPRGYYRALLILAHPVGNDGNWVL